MTTYYLHRLSEMPKTIQRIPVDYFGLDAVRATNGDKFVLYVAGILQAIGTYTLQQHVFVLDKQINIDMRNVLNQLSFVREVTPSTLRMLKKKNREITPQDFALFSSKN